MMPEPDVGPAEFHPNADAAESHANTQPARPHGAEWREFRAGAKATLPLIVGAIPFGIIFGAVAVNSGLSIWATAALSLFVFAG